MYSITQILTFAIAFSPCVLAISQQDGTPLLRFNRRAAHSTGWEPCYENDLHKRFTHLGCMTPHAGSTILQFQVGNDKPAIKATSMTVTDCWAACTALGARYCALSNGSQCWCGNELKGRRTSDTCDVACTGGVEDGRPCGGKTTFSVYQDRTFSTEWDPDVAAKGYKKDLGCFQDDSNRLTIRPYAYLKDLTREKCFVICAREGSCYSAVEAGYACFCGNTLRPGHQAIDAQRCASKCYGKPGELCGGGWAMRIFYNEDLDTRKQCGRPQVFKGQAAQKPMKNTAGKKAAGGKKGKVEVVTMLVTETRTITETIKKKPVTRLTTVTTEIVTTTTRGRGAGAKAKPTDKDTDAENDKDTDDEKSNAPKQNGNQRPTVTVTVTVFDGAKGADKAKASNPAKPAEEPAEESDDKPAKKPASKPAEEPAEEPAPKPAKKPADKSADKPTDKSTDKSTEKPGEKAVDKSAEKPAKQAKKKKPAPAKDEKKDGGNSEDSPSPQAGGYRM
ncbi:hypothetical protein TWF696_004711 [Orbilia brochopaga]|uniref:WSC domain-containing protein n=1 Tax=Orbilia brochopaga TaxID=3140254 RepID=A0AAV9V2J7_9PEZI